jgi:predicted ester cyclase
VVTRWRATATHTSPVLGVPPTGRRLTVTGVNVARVSNGQIVESWFNFDLLTLLQGIGAIPSPQHA